MLKQNPFYHSVTLYGKIYLIPFGQRVAEHAPAFQVNETGLWIWDHLQKVQKAPMSEDQQAFLQMLQTNGLIEDQERQDSIDKMNHPQLMISLIENREPVENVWQTLSIADFRIQLRGAEYFFSEEFLPFVKGSTSSDSLPEVTDPDQRISVTFSEADHSVDASYIIKDPQLCVLEGADFWILQYPSFTAVQETLLSKDGRTARIYVCPGAEEKDPDNLKFEVFHAIRIPFLILAQQNGFGVLHSASIRYHDRAWLFSAPSGTGKSTHVNFWKEAGWADILNGDLNLIGIRENQAYIYGIPWCGTSEIASTETVPLGGIYLLKQSASDKIQSLPPDQALLRTSQRLITPSWTWEMLEKNLSFCRKLIETIPIQELQCTPTAESARVVKSQIDAGMLA